MPGDAPASGPRRITLLTDFGMADGYAAAMRGVIATITPSVLVEDASHDIAPGDVASAAWCLAAYWDRYPPGTVHLIVVDPGVGGERRPLAGIADGRFLVAPDNGVLSRVLAGAAETTLVHLRESAVATGSVSSTFHGRDIFAPAAALLARGVPLAELGDPISNPIRLAEPAPRRDDAAVYGEVVHVDRFGNLITNVPGAWVAGARDVEVGGRAAGAPRRSYVDVERGRAVALIGSMDRLEIAVRDGSAAARLGAGRGTNVIVRF